MTDLQKKEKKYSAVINSDKHKEKEEEKSEQRSGEETEEEKSEKRRGEKEHLTEEKLHEKREKSNKELKFVCWLVSVGAGLESVTGPFAQYVPEPGAHLVLFNVLFSQNSLKKILKVVVGDYLCEFAFNYEVPSGVECAVVAVVAIPQIDSTTEQLQGVRVMLFLEHSLKISTQPKRKADNDLNTCAKKPRKSNTSENLVMEDTTTNEKQSNKVSQHF